MHTHTGKARLSSMM